MTPTTALARKIDPITSKMAADSVKPKPYMMRLLEQFAKRSQTSEMAAERADLLHIGYWKRVSDLRRAGWITVRTDLKGTPLMWFNASGRRALVWKITDEGREALRTYKAQAA